MTSSLAQQLKRLSVPSTALSCHGPSKHRASLLFDSKEAAMLDREQVFNIGGNIFLLNFFSIENFPDKMLYWDFVSVML